MSKADKFTKIGYLELTKMLNVLGRVGVKKLPADEAKIRFIGMEGKIIAVANGSNVTVEIDVADTNEEFDIAVSYKKLKSSIGAYPNCEVRFNRDREKVEVLNDKKVVVRFPITYNSSLIYRISKEDKTPFAKANDFIEAFDKVSGMDRGGDAFNILSGVYIEKNSTGLGSLVTTNTSLMFSNYECSEDYVIATDTFMNLLKSLRGDFDIQKTEQKALYFEDEGVHVIMNGYSNDYPKLKGMTPDKFDGAEIAVIIKPVQLEEVMGRALSILGGDALMLIDLTEDSMYISISSDDSEIKESVSDGIEVLKSGTFPESLSLNLGKLNNVMSALDIVNDSNIEIRVNRNSTLVKVDNSYYGIVSNKARIK